MGKAIARDADVLPASAGAEVGAVVLARVGEDVHVGEHVAVGAQGERVRGRGFEGGEAEFEEEDGGVGELGAVDCG